MKESPELQNPTAPKTEKSLYLNNAINRYVTHLESISDTFARMKTILVVTNLNVSKKFNTFLENECIKIGTTTEDGRINYSIPPNKDHKRKILRRKVENSKMAHDLIPRGIFVSLISEYDSYLGYLIRAILYLKPEILCGSEKSLLFSKLLELNSIDDAREYLIEKEVESILRENHAQHFAWFEKKLSVPLTKDLKCWSKFIEITERRNLFVHNDGIVSNHYISVCTAHNVNLPPNIKAGDQLTVEPEYFDEAYRCLFEMGIKLAQVIWRKLIKAESKIADFLFIKLVFDQIIREDYQLAIELAEFSTHKVIQHENEEIRLTCIINKAQAYKWNGDIEKCKQIIGEIDWSACENKFKLVSTVLLEDYDMAYAIMRKMGSSHEDVGKAEYKDWPIFKEFRKHEHFKPTYLEIFGEEFVEDDLDFKTPEINFDLENAN
jgi:hypothetical protein